jgi:hypothetical protein
MRTRIAQYNVAHVLSSGTALALAAEGGNWETVMALLSMPVAATCFVPCCSAD